MDRSPEVIVLTGRAWERPGLVLPVFALVSLVGGTFPSFSAAANVLVASVGGVMGWWGLSRDRRGRALSPPQPLPRGGAVWLLPLGLLVAVESVTFVLGFTNSLGTRDDHPTLSRLADPLLDHQVPRSLFCFAWMCGFWGLVKR